MCSFFFGRGPNGGGGAVRAPANHYAGLGVGERTPWMNNNHYPGVWEHLGHPTDVVK